MAKHICAKGLARLFAAAEDENSVSDLAAFCKPKNYMSEFPLNFPGQVKLRLLGSLAQFAVQNVCKRGFSFDQGMGQINRAPRNTGWILFLHWKITTIWAPCGTTIPGDLVLDPYPGLAGV